MSLSFQGGSPLILVMVLARPPYINYGLRSIGRTINNYAILHLSLMWCSVYHFVVNSFRSVRKVAYAFLMVKLCSPSLEQTKIGL